MTRTFLVRLACSAAIALAAAAVMAARPAGAAALKPSVTVMHDIVTLGDLFEGAGAFSGTPAFRAPDVGVEGELPAAAALAAARAAGMPVDEGGLDRIRVVRAATYVAEGDIRALLHPAVADRLGADADTVELALDGLIEPVAADASASEPAFVSALAVQAASGRFQARINVDVGEGSRTVEISGRVTETIEIPVLVRSLERREVIAASDMRLSRVDRRRLGRTALTDPAAAVGMAVRRPLRAGDTIAATDLEQPRLVGRGELVTLIFEKPGLTLTARGRALADAARGEAVSVLNEQSRRTVHGIATAAGVVRIDAPAPLVVGQAGAPVRPIQ